MRKSFVLLAVLVTGSAQAWDCKYEREIDATLVLDGSEQLSVLAGAGDLEITGQAGLGAARVRGKVCASEEEWMAEAAILTEGGRNAEIAVSLPDTDGGWSFMGSRYVYIDLRIEVPDSMPLDIQDSSGDVKIAGTASIAIRDSSGDVDIENVNGGVVLEDSSGDINLQDIGGDVTVRHDSSGDIYGRAIEGSVLVEKDSSGDIRFRDVRDDFVVERDSSGDIVAETVGGDFRVLRDGSGDISPRDVSGEVAIPGKS